LIAENIFSQLDENGYNTALMEAIVDIKKDEATAVSMEDKYVVSKGSNRRRLRRITVGWKLLAPPRMDRLDAAGGLTPGLSEPGNKESTGNRTMYWKRLPQQCILLSYALRNAYPVPDRKDCVSYLVGRRAKGEKECKS
jgi:hypothetical protein